MAPDRQYGNALLGVRHQEEERSRYSNVAAHIRAIGLTPSSVIVSGRNKDAVLQKYVESSMHWKRRDSCISDRKKTRKLNWAVSGFSVLMHVCMDQRSRDQIGASMRRSVPRRAASSGTDWYEYS